VFRIKCAGQNNFNTVHAGNVVEKQIFWRQLLSTWLIRAVCLQKLPFSQQSQSTTLDTATPSSLSYDRGAHFRPPARQAAKSCWEINWYVENANGNKKLSYSQANSVFKAVKNEE
jgi:hypothetical protein